MTVLEEMIFGLKHGIQRRIDENQAKREALVKGSSGFIQQSITYSSRISTGKQALQDVIVFEQLVKKMLSYKGDDPNYLLMETTAASGLFYSKHPELSRKIEK